MPDQNGVTTLELDAIIAEELDSAPVSELVTDSELITVSSLLDSRTPSRLLEEGTLQLQGAALGLSLSQATSANARSDTAESPHAMLVILFFMIPFLFAPKP
jgi:hypothetical protein